MTSVGAREGRCHDLCGGTGRQEMRNSRHVDLRGSGDSVPAGGQGVQHSLATHRMHSEGRVTKLHTVHQLQDVTKLHTVHQLQDAVVQLSTKQVTHANAELSIKQHRLKVVEPITRYRHAVTRLSITQ